jgi:hypothetical protein
MEKPVATVRRLAAVQVPDSEFAATDRLPGAGATLAAYESERGGVKMRGDTQLL